MKPVFLKIFFSILACVGELHSRLPSNTVLLHKYANSADLQHFVEEKYFSRLAVYTKGRCFADDERLAQEYVRKYYANKYEDLVANFLSRSMQETAFSLSILNQSLFFIKSQILSGVVNSFEKMGFSLHEVLEKEKVVNELFEFIWECPYKTRERLIQNTMQSLLEFVLPYFHKNSLVILGSFDQEGWGPEPERRTFQNTLVSFELKKVLNGQDLNRFEEKDSDLLVLIDSAITDISHLALNRKGLRNIKAVFVKINFNEITTTSFDFLSLVKIMEREEFTLAATTFSAERPFVKSGELKDDISVEGVLFIKNSAYLSFDKQKEAQFLQKNNLVSEGDLVFDVGADVGEKAEIYVKLGAKVVCFEPRKESVRVLQHRFRGFPVSLEICGIGKDGEGTLYVCTDGSGLSSLSEEFIHNSYFKQRGTIWDQERVIPLVSLKKMIEKYGVPKFCKIDVENYEYEVLSSLGDVLPQCLSFEFHGEFQEKVKKCLYLCKELGYTKINFSKESESIFYFPDFITSVETCLEALEKESSAYEKKSPGYSLYGDVYVAL